MKRIILSTAVLSVATALLVAAGPAVEPAQAKCRAIRIDHPRDPGWATYCGLTIAICDNQADGHDTYVRRWDKQFPGRAIPKESDPIPKGQIFDPKDAFLTVHDTFGRWSGRRRVPQFCSYEKEVFPPTGFSVCVSGGEGCSKVRRVAD